MVLASRRRNVAPQGQRVPENFRKDQVEQGPLNPSPLAARLRSAVRPILWIFATAQFALKRRAKPAKSPGRRLDASPDPRRRSAMDGMIAPAETGAFLGVDRSVCGKRWRLRA